MPHEKRIVILTGSEARHTFFRKWIALCPGIQVASCYAEGLEKSIGTLVQAQEENELRLMHLKAREQSEEDFFGIFNSSADDKSHPIFLPKGEINSAAHVDAIIKAAPDLIVGYGCSLIKGPLLAAFSGRFMNIHLGLSPYYRGSGTNYWPLVNNEPEYVGATFMHIDAGVDTGEVIHQIRCRIAPGDMPAQIGNRVIVDAAEACQKIILAWDELKSMPQIPPSAKDRVYKKKDYTEASVEKLYANFRDGLAGRYLKEEAARCAATPIIENPAVKEVA